MLLSAAALLQSLLCFSASVRDYVLGSACAPRTCKRVFFLNTAAKVELTSSFRQISPARERRPQPAPGGRRHRHADRLQEQRLGSVDTRRWHHHPELRVRRHRKEKMMAGTVFGASWEKCACVCGGWGWVGVTESSCFTGMMPVFTNNEVAGSSSNVSETYLFIRMQFYFTICKCVCVCVIFFLMD